MLVQFPLRPWLAQIECMRPPHGESSSVLCVRILVLMLRPKQSCTSCGCPNPGHLEFQLPNPLYGASAAPSRSMRAIGSWAEPCWAEVPLPAEQRVRQGPCIIYNEDNGTIKAFRKIPGVTLLNVSKLNILKLAPGGHVGHFCIWTESAFRKLDELYGPWRKAASLKSNYNLPMHKTINTDMSRILKSPEIQRALWASRKKIHHRVLKKNPLKNLRIMLKLNPYAKTMRRNTILHQARNHTIHLDKAAAWAARLEEKVEGKKPVEEKKEKKVAGTKKPLKKPLGKNLQLPRNQQLKRNLLKKSSLLHKLLKSKSLSHTGLQPQLSFHLPKRQGIVPRGHPPGPSARQALATFLFMKLLRLASVPWEAQNESCGPRGPLSCQQVSVDGSACPEQS
ncbi:60S ribosomal protein L4 [Heterocephalus glaber]|uniref:60S ribosomal protein L4 n=1 Tax=Heterocephalus glaber TaxID=10181 RepID=G5B2J5_HETGA|nr:60S ribosomal protein L4 [Heterocephalus glaber]